MGRRQPTASDTPIPILSKPANRALSAHSYFTLQDLQSVEAKELLRLHGVGHKAIRLLRAAFKAHNLPHRLGE